MPGRLPDRYSTQASMTQHIITPLMPVIIARQSMAFQS